MGQMTVSELIKALQKIEIRHGDAGVMAAGGVWSVDTGTMPVEIIVERLIVGADGDIVLTEESQCPSSL